MKPKAYYNEYDKTAAQWLRELIKDGLIIDGEVDERSITDVPPTDLLGFTQCHFFAGIGVWPLALRLAGWPDDRPVWTGSEPCQPFSDAGKGLGFADERYLRPYWQHQIAQCCPPTIFGEQVASKDGLAWLDVIQADLEGEGYAFGAVDTCAAGFGAPHIRQRLYWLADANCEQHDRTRRSGSRWRAEYSDGGAIGRLADAISGGQQGASRRGTTQEQRIAERGLFSRLDDTASSRHIRTFGNTEGDPRDEARLRMSDTGRETGRVAHSTSDGRREERQDAGWRLIRDRAERFAAGLSSSSSSDYRPGPTNGFWRDVDWLHCRDGKWRAVESGTFPLAHAGAFRNRVAELRGAGNALNLAQAVGFIEAFLETEADGFRE